MDSQIQSTVEFDRTHKTQTSANIRKTIKTKYARIQVYFGSVLWAAYDSNLALTASVQTVFIPLILNYFAQSSNLKTKANGSNRNLYGFVVSKIRSGSGQKRSKGPNSKSFVEENKKTPKQIIASTKRRSNSTSPTAAQQGAAPDRFRCARSSLHSSGG